MARLERKVTVDRPVDETYGAWTRFDEVPQVMRSVESIEVLDETHQRWHVTVDGRNVSFEAEIVEQAPNHRIGWRTTGGAAHSGAVAFRTVGEQESTEVEVSIDLAQHTPVSDAVLADTVGQALAEDLRRFKQHVESRATASSDTARSGPGRRPATSSRIDRVAAAVATAGALNWGLVALGRKDLVGRLLGGGPYGRASLKSRLAYGLVGVAGAYTAVRRVAPANREG